MKPLVVRVCAFIALSLVASPGEAQSQRLYAAYLSTLVELDSSPARLGRVLRSWTLPGHPFGMTAIGTGRFLVWPSASAVSVFDTVSGQLTSLALIEPASHSEIVGVSPEGDELVLVAWSSFGGPSSIVVLKTPDLTARTIALPGGCHQAFAYASAARQVVSLRPATCGFAPPDEQWIDITNLDDGETRERVFDVPYGYGQGIATNPAGTRVWVGTLGGGFAAPAGYGVFDAQTGDLLGLNSSVRPVDVVFIRPRFDVDVNRGLVLTVTTDGLAALDADTLQVVGRTDVPAPRLSEFPPPAGYDSTFDYQVLWHPDAALAFAYEATGATYSYHGGPCLHSALAALDPATGSRRATRDIAEIAGQPLCGVEFAMAVAPSKPAAFTASVWGHQVMLSWTRPPRTTHYELEVGSGPGLRNIGVFIPDANPFVVNDVPPGTYYVRVRALNYGGKGPYSDELTVVVR